MTTHHPPAHSPRMLTFISGATPAWINQCTERRWGQPRAPQLQSIPCHLPTPLPEFKVIQLRLYISSSTSLSPPSLPIYFFPSRSNALLREKMHDLWRSIFTGYWGEGKERASDKTGGEAKGQTDGGESVKREPKGKEDRRVWRRHPSPCDPSASNEDR